MSVGSRLLPKIVKLHPCLHCTGRRWRDFFPFVCGTTVSRFLLDHLRKTTYTRNAFFLRFQTHVYLKLMCVFSIAKVRFVPRLLLLRRCNAVLHCPARLPFSCKFSWVACLVLRPPVYHCAAMELRSRPLTCWLVGRAFAQVSLCDASASGVTSPDFKAICSPAFLRQLHSRCYFFCCHLWQKNSC